jgi:hypothetical protein
MLELEFYRVGSHLQSLYYIPNAISPAEEAALLREIRASKQAWKTVSGGCGGGWMGGGGGGMGVWR